ncbi:MAG: hypothetical protein ACR2PA_01430 [Hyphomicrobiaceae bacterium]
MRNIDIQTVGAGLLAACTIGALFAPAISSLLAPNALNALFLVVVLSLISLVEGSKSNLLLMDKRTWIIVAWQQLVLPSIVLAIAILAEIPNKTASLMIVTACAGSLFASPMLAGLLDLNRRRALQAMILSTLVMPATLYMFLTVLNGDHAELDLYEYVRHGTIYLAIPIAILWIYAFLVRFLRPTVVSVIAEGSRWGSLVALLVFVVGIMEPVSQHLHTNLNLIVFYLSIVSALSIGMYLLTVIVMYRFGIREAMTAGVLSGFRNVGLCFALVGDMLGPELALYVGLSMIPVAVAPAAIRLMVGGSENAELETA